MSIISYAQKLCEFQFQKDDDLLSVTAVGFFILGKRLGSLKTNGEASPESQEFITAVRKLFNNFTDLMFSLPLYRIYPTKIWKTVVSGNIEVHKLARHFINEKLAEIEEEDRKALEASSSEEEAPDKVDFLTYLVHSGKMSIEEVSVNIVDLLSGGVETVSLLVILFWSFASNVYHLSTSVCPSRLMV